MAKVAIVTDSTGHLNSEVTRNLPIHYVPLQVIWGEKTYYDHVDITPDQFYSQLKGSKILPSTSQPSPATFLALYKRLVEEGYEILSIHISAKLSGTMDSAIQARAMMSGARIEVFDSESTSLAMGFQVLAAARLAAEGGTLAECKAVAEHARLNTGVYFLVDTLEYLHRGGRIGGAAAFMGTVLNLKPILELRNGRIEAVERVRTAAKARDRLVELLIRRVENGRCPIRIAGLYTVDVNDATGLIEAARQRFGIADVAETVIGTVSPVLGVHTGPGAMGLAFMTGL